MMHVSPSIVRLAKPEDRLEVWRMLLDDHRENGIFQLSVEKVDWLLTRLLQPEFIPPDDLGTRGIMGVIGPVGALEAVAAVVISSAWYSTERCLNDLVIFVDPAFRQSGHAKALLDWVKQQAAITGLFLISGVVSNQRTQAKCRLYQRQMPNKIGEYFLWDPKLVIGSSIAMSLNVDVGQATPIGQG